LIRVRINPDKPFLIGHIVFAPKVPTPTSEETVDSTETGEGNYSNY